MPIPLLPPVAPLIAPDLRPIAAQSRGTLTIYREKGTTRIVDRSLETGVWIDVEDAPLEVRFHRRDDGSVWAEQAFYAAGDRGIGTASQSSAATLLEIDARKVFSLGRLRGFATFTMRSVSGAVVATWSSTQCGESYAFARLDRADSPVNPTFPTSYDACGLATFALGRVLGVDRGWAMLANTQLPRTVKNVQPGRYQLEVVLNHDGGIAESNLANNAVTVPLVVKYVAVAADDEDEGDGEGMSASVGSGAIAVVREQAPRIGPRGAVVRRNDARPAGLVRHQHKDGTVDEHRANGDTAGHHREPDWVGSQLRVIDNAIRHDEAVREAGRPKGTISTRADAPAAPVGVDLPNLKSAPSYGIAGRTAKVRGKRRDYIDFGALTYNAGPGRLEVEAFRESGTTLDAFQVFFRDGVRQSRQARGTLIWHAAPGHNHFHFQSFARYRLLTMGGAVVRDSGKSSWCIVDTDLVDATLPGTPNPSITTEQNGAGGCGSEPGSLWARLSMSVGSGDYYIQSIAGQSFDITTIKNGMYRIQIEANPTGVIAETSLDDNVSTRTVSITGSAGKRRVIPRKHPLVIDSPMSVVGVGA